MIRIRDISLAPEHEAGALLYEAAKALGVSASEIQKLTIVRRSIDARKRHTSPAKSRSSKDAGASG